MSYDQWKTASPHDEGDTPTCVDLTDEFMRAYGRIGHGLCGKDADLDYGGQIRVVFFGVSDDYLIAEFEPYATICSNDEWDKETLEFAAEIIWNSDIPVEWDGDDWGAYDAKTTIKVPLGAADAAEIKKLSDLDSETIEKAYDAIFEACGEFQKKVAYLSKELDKLESFYD